MSKNPLFPNKFAILASILGVRDFGIPNPGNSIDTGISVNAGGYGNTVLVMSCDHGGSGDATYSGIFMLRFGYDGNNVHATKIAEENNATSASALSFSVSDAGTLVISGFHNKVRIIFVRNP